MTDKKTYLKEYYAENRENIRATQKEYRAKNRASIKNNHLKHKYNITLEQYDLMLTEQNGQCKICKSPEPRGKGTFHVDHDHKTGLIRGLLCHGCNLMLGFAKDSPELLVIAASYLRESI